MYYIILVLLLKKKTLYTHHRQKQFDRTIFLILKHKIAKEKMSERGPPSSKRQRKLAEAKSRNMTKGQLWRAREKKSKIKNINALKGKKGILIITNRNRERIGANEAINLLDLAGEENGSGSDDSEDDDEEEEVVDLQTQIENELQAARTARRKVKRFDIGMSCLTLVECPQDPLDIVSKLFDSVIEEGKAKSTHIEKLIPFQVICHSSIDAIVSCVRELIKDVFTETGKSNTFAIVPKVRGAPPPASSSSTTAAAGADDTKGKDTIVLDRNVLIESIADLIDQNKHPVNLTEPDIVILVEVLRSITGITIVSGEVYRKFKRFHLRALTDPNANEQ
jgi:tRNA acetyltransferase TAN1